MSNPPERRTKDEVLASILSWIHQKDEFSKKSSRQRPRLRINKQFVASTLPYRGGLNWDKRGRHMEDGREAWLLVHDDNTGAPSSSVIELSNQETVFGRAENADVRLLNHEVSRHHFCIEWLGTHVWQIRDLGSRNGVLVNGALVQSAKLRSGDEIICSEFMFKFLFREEFDEMRRILDSAGHLDFHTQTFNRQFLRFAFEYFKNDKDFQEIFFGVVTICIHNLSEIIDLVGAGGCTLVLRNITNKIKELLEVNNRFNPYHHQFLCHLGEGQFAALITFQRPHAPMELAERCRYSLLEQRFPILGDVCQPKFSMGIINLTWEHLGPTLRLLGGVFWQEEQFGDECGDEGERVDRDRPEIDVSPAYTSRDSSEVTPCDTIMVDDDGASFEFDVDEPTMARETVDQHSLELNQPDSSAHAGQGRLEWTRPWYEDDSLPAENDGATYFYIPPQRFSGAKGFMVLQNPPNQGLRFDLNDAQPATVGRSSNCIIHLTDPSVSERHARIVERLDKGTGEYHWVVEDQLSTNGTFVNGERIEQERVLRTGDLVQFGNVWFKFFHVFDDILHYRKEAFRLQNLDPATGAYRYPYLQWVLQTLQRRHEKEGRSFTCLFFTLLGIEQVQLTFGEEFVGYFMEDLASRTLEILYEYGQSNENEGRPILAIIPTCRMVVVLPDATLQVAESLRLQIVHAYWQCLKSLEEFQLNITLDTVLSEYGSGDYSPILHLLPSAEKSQDLPEDHVHGSSTIAIKVDASASDEPRLIPSQPRSNPAGGLRYAVTIGYREPSYERYTGEKKDPYVWTFDIEAPDMEQAKKQAIAKFRKMEALSSVGWTREIVSVECKLRKE